MICEYFLLGYGLSFHFLKWFFKEKFLHLMKSNLSVFTLLDHTFGGTSKKSLPKQRLCFLLEILELGFNFRSIFKFIFVYSMRYGLKFILFHTDIELFQHQLLKRPSSLPFITFTSFSNTSCPYMYGPISEIPIMFN